MADSHPQHSLGIGHLASAAFGAGARPDPEEILARYAAAQSRLIRGEHARDARALLRSPLTADELAFLWCACSDQNFQPVHDAKAGREWTETAFAILSRDSDPATVGLTLRGGDDPALTSRIRDMIGRFTADQHVGHGFAHCTGQPDDARRILRGLAGSGQPDLAFRLFLVLAANYHMQIPADLYAEIAAISTELRHPEHLLDGVSPAQ